MVYYLFAGLEEFFETGSLGFGELVEWGEIVVEVKVKSVLLCFQDVVDVFDEGVFFLVAGSVAVDFLVGVFMFPGGFVELDLAS